MRTALRLLTLAALLAPSAVSAGDFADRDIIGFSPDGGVFAFEEYGEFDGSGFPYSTIYVIDTDNDSWLTGTPVRVTVGNEEASLDEVRAAARKQARPVLAKHSVGAEGMLAVSNPETELSVDPHSVRFLTNPYLRHDDRTWTVTLADIPFPDARPCENLGPVNGFRLVLSSAAGASRVLHEDKSLPTSRGCAQGYAIADVILYSPKSREPVMVVLLRVYTQGFEGPDGRYVAVAVRLESPLTFSN